MTTARVGESPPEVRGVRRALGSHSARQLGTLAGLLTLCLVLWAATPHFLTVSNLLNVLEQTALNAVVAVGMTFGCNRSFQELEKRTRLSCGPRRRDKALASSCAYSPTPVRARRAGR